MKKFESKKILVTFLMQMGDLILTTPFLSALRKNIPNAKIYYLIDKKWLDLIKYNPDVDEILTIDRKGRDNSLSALWKYSKKLKDNDFDLLINLNPSERCSFLAAFSGAKYKTGTSHRLFVPFFDKSIRLNRSLHAADMYLDVLAQLGFNNLANEGLKVISSTCAKEKSNDFFLKNNLNDDDTIIGFNIGSASETKRWLPERFAAVADYAIEKGYKVLFLGSKNELDTVKESVKSMKYSPIIATGEFSLDVLTDVIAKLDLLITNDSGPMHLAISQKTPIVALYGPSKEDLYGPYKAENFVVVRADPPCNGCEIRMKHKCDDLKCMYGISEEQVINAMDNMISKGVVNEYRCSNNSF